MPARDLGADEQPVSAPRALRVVAGLINAALLAAVYWQWFRPGRVGAGAYRDPARLQRRLRLLGPAAGVLGQQLGSPGGWIMGLRTVDRRTGRRVALRRTLAVVLLRSVTEAARHHLVPARHSISESEREEFGRELRAIRERYPGDGRRLAGASSRFYERGRVDVSRSRWLLAAIVPALINSGLRRRLAPTVVVLARPRRHSP